MLVLGNRVTYPHTLHNPISVAAALQEVQIDMGTGYFSVDWWPIGPGMGAYLWLLPWLTVRGLVAVVPAELTAQRHRYPKAELSVFTTIVA